MKTIYLVTTNEAKVKEAQSILTRIRVVQVNREVPELKTQSMRETIVQKAKKAYEMVRRPIVVEDTGFFLNTYPNFPGTYTKFAILCIGLEGILKLLKDKNRRAYFLTMVAFYDGKNLNVFEGKVNGMVTEKIVLPEVHKLPYDSIFIPVGHKKTYSQMTPQEKAKTSHRAKAFLALEREFA